MNIEEYFGKFFAGTKDPSLDAMKFFMEEFAHPEDKTKFIHVAGTNGKGSVCEMINNILIKAGYKVGKFISPHLVRYNERICLNNQEITNEEMQEILKEIEIKIKKYEELYHIPVTQFEVITTLALIYYARKNCDFVVLETGLGGTYDCTNIVDADISVITSIGYDHMDILGKTLEEIAENKAGIIKKNRDTVMCYQEKVNDVFERKCEEENNTLHLIKEADIKNYQFDGKFQYIDYKEYKNIKINLKGKAQIYNAVEALECIDILKQKGYLISEDAVRQGLSTVIHKARFEELSNNPKIIYDGGHNEGAINNLINTIKMYYPNNRKVYILSILKSKDYKTVVKNLSQDKDGIFIFTTGNNPDRYVAKEDLYKEAEKNLNQNIYKEELEDAIQLAKEKYKDDVIMIIGSFYIYSDVLEILKK